MAPAISVASQAVIRKPASSVSSTMQRHERDEHGQPEAAERHERLSEHDWHR